MSGDYDHQLRDLEYRIDSLESDLGSLSGKFGYTEDLDHELRDIRSEVSSSDSRVDDLDTDLRDHITQTDRAVKRLIGQVQLLEGHLLAAGGARRADLDTFTDEQRRLARRVSSGWEARDVLLSRGELSDHQYRVQRQGTVVAQRREQRDAVVAAVGS